MAAITKPARGFTLTELAVVLVIVALLMGGLLMPLSAQKEVERRQATSQQLASIREALIAFASISGRLPCPDTNNDGMEEVSCTGDATGDGLLPWKNLNLSPLDAWGSPWRYRIERGYANYTTLRNQILLNASTSDCTGMSAFPSDCIDLYDNANVRQNTTTEHPIAVIYSLGPNQQADGRNASYEPNRLNSPSYQADGNATDFDDMLIWINRSHLINPLIAVGKLP